MTRPNALLILIDSLRHDVVANAEFRRAVTPTLDRLVAEGSFGKVVAQASNTQFVMPAFLSGTAPLDHGGYNDGCKRRPVCFPEAICDAGYRTALFSNCVLFNRDLGFDRGFEQTCVPINTRRALMQDIEYRLLEPVRRWRDGETSDAEITQVLQREYGEILDNLIEVHASGRGEGVIPRAARINRRLADDARKERILLDRAPLLVAQKLSAVPEAYYYAALGKTRVGGRLQMIRIINKAYTTVGRVLGKIGPLRHIRFGHFDAIEPLGEELLPRIIETLAVGERPWFTMLHLMDVHTYAICFDQILRRPIMLAKRLGRLSRIRRHCRKQGYDAPLLYFLNLSILDDMLGRLLETLRVSGQMENTLIFVTSDHGATLPTIDARLTPDLTRRFLRADIETPFIVSGPGFQNTTQSGLRDSRDVGATVLDCLGIQIPQGHEGRSVFNGTGRDVVVSENAGRGFCDLQGDLNFSVTAATRKLFARLRGSKIDVTEVYDLGSDPGERENLVGQLDADASSASLLGALLRERAPLFTSRDVVIPPVERKSQCAL